MSVEASFSPNSKFLKKFCPLQKLSPKNHTGFWILARTAEPYLKEQWGQFAYRSKCGWSGTLWNSSMLYIYRLTAKLEKNQPNPAPSPWESILFKLEGLYYRGWNRRAHVCFSCVSSFCTYSLFMALRWENVPGTSCVILLLCKNLRSRRETSRFKMMCAVCIKQPTVDRKHPSWLQMSLKTAQHLKPVRFAGMPGLIITLLSLTAGLQSAHGWWRLTEIHSFI